MPKREEQAEEYRDGVRVQRCSVHQLSAALPNGPFVLTPQTQPLFNLPESFERLPLEGVITSGAANYSAASCWRRWQCAPRYRLGEPSSRDDGLAAGKGRLLPGRDHPRCARLCIRGATRSSTRSSASRSRPPQPAAPVCPASSSRAHGTAAAVGTAGSACRRLAPTAHLPDGAHLRGAHSSRHRSSRPTAGG